MISRAIYKPFVLLLFVFLVSFPLRTADADSAKGIRFLEELEAGLVALADLARPTVVNLSPYIAPSSGTSEEGPKKRRGRPTNAGAGVIIDGKKGLIVTNSHVVRHVEKVQVTILGGEKLVGRVIGTDEDTDLAVVKVDVEKPLAAAPWGDSSKVRVGQIAVAVGNPYGLNDTLTFGVVSGKNRENINISRYEDFLQTDASINPGNSGGPLFSVRGEIIGINTAIINYAQSIGFSIPSNMARNVVEQIIAYGEVRRGWLGVGIEPVSPDLARREKIAEGKGVLVNSVFEGDPAEKSGVKVGDIVLKIGGETVYSPASMIRAIGSISPGQMVQLDIIRGGERKVIFVTMGRQDKEKTVTASLERKPRFPLGIRVEDPVEELIKKYGLQGGKGVIVSEVAPESPAGKKGLQPGDRITAVNGDTVLSKKDFEVFVKRVPTGGAVFLLVERKEERFHLGIIREK